MPLLQGLNELSDLPNTSSPSLHVASVKAFDDGHVLVNSAEVASSTSSKPPRDGDNDFLVTEEPLTCQPVELPKYIEVDSSTAPNVAFQKPHADILTAFQALQVIESYSTQYESKKSPWHGLVDYAPLVTAQIRAGEPIRMLYSGFGFKSPLSSGRVLGNLPDLGEKLALAQLDGMCSNIAAVYDKGAEVHICSNGLVYNDLFGVTDDSVWAYENALQNMAMSNGLKHLRFIKLSDILGHEPGIWTKEYAAEHTKCLRRELLYRSNTPTDQLSPRDEVVDGVIGAYVDQALSPSNESSASLVRCLKSRLNACAAALEVSRPDYVHLASQVSGSVRGNQTLSISLNPQSNGLSSLEPWHSVIAIELDGRYRTASAEELRDAYAYELVHDTTRAPSHYRAKTPIWDWKADGLDVTFEHQYPTGTIIRPGSSYTNATPSIRTLPMHKVRMLSQAFSPIVLRGFSETTNEEQFLAKGHELGEILTWTFGQILKVKDSGEVDKNANNVTSNEAMPMHFDGIFKFVDTIDPETGEIKKVLTPPRYQYFTCLSPAPRGDGYTLFANSRLFFQHLPDPFSLSRLEKVTWSMVNDGFWSAKQTELPLVVRHKETGAACLRWHQPWTQTKFSKYYIEIENDVAAEELVEVINNILYDFRVCFRFEWEQGDLLINDNVSMLHTRTAFVGNCEREMWRIHFN